MNKEWLDRFSNTTGSVAGGQVDEAGNISFEGTAGDSASAIANTDTTERPVLVELSRLSVIDIKGADAVEFLQAQVCNDLTLMDSHQVQINGYCTPKGRLSALFTVFPMDYAAQEGTDAEQGAIEKGYRLVLPDDIADAFAKRLTMFVLRAKVTITVREDLVCAGLVGRVSSAGDALARASLPENFPALPNNELELAGNDSAQVYRWHNDADLARYVCIADADTLFKLWQVDNFIHSGYAYWRWGDINAGVPNVYAVSKDQFIPQMLNMQFINGLSFKKGCYPGQEIVARMHYLGKLKKHMLHLVQPGGKAIPEPATTLTTESNNNAGQVVDAILDENGLNILAVVNTETNIDELQLNGESVKTVALPYSTEVKAKT